MERDTAPTGYGTIPHEHKITESQSAFNRWIEAESRQYGIWIFNYRNYLECAWNGAIEWEQKRFAHSVKSE